MSKFKVGDRVRIAKTDYESYELSVGKTGVVRDIGNMYTRILLDNQIQCKIGTVWNFEHSWLEKIINKNPELIESPESTNKKIKQSLLRLYLSNIEQTVKSEKIIDYVKQEIGTDYKFGDTILRALRQLRQDRQLDYEVVGEKKDRNYKFKKI